MHGQHVAWAKIVKNNKIYCLQRIINKKKGHRKQCPLIINGQNYSIHISLTELFSSKLINTFADVLFSRI